MILGPLASAISAFYDVSVRSLAGLGSGFLPTDCRRTAVAFASYFVDWSYPLGMSASLRLPVSYRGLAPHKFTPMLGVPKCGRIVPATPESPSFFIEGGDVL